MAGGRARGKLVKGTGLGAGKSSETCPVWRYLGLARWSELSNDAGDWANGVGGSGHPGRASLKLVASSAGDARRGQAPRQREGPARLVGS